MRAPRRLGPRGRHPRRCAWTRCGRSAIAPFGIDLDGLDVEALTETLRALPPEQPRRPGLRERAGPHADQPAHEHRLRRSAPATCRELALGWCTYNGDHMSMYNPNVSIPKTLVKFLVGWAAEQRVRRRGPARRCSTSSPREISPELLPTDADGRDRAGDRERRSAPTSCTTSSCTTSCATARRRRRSSSWPSTPTFDRDVPAGRAAAAGCGCSCGASSPTSSSGRACRTARRSARSACRRAATGMPSDASAASVVRGNGRMISTEYDVVSCVQLPGWQSSRSLSVVGSFSYRSSRTNSIASSPVLTRPSSCAHERRGESA